MKNLGKIRVFLRAKTSPTRLEARSGQTSYFVSLLFSMDKMEQKSQQLLEPISGSKAPRWQIDAPLNTPKITACNYKGGMGLSFTSTTSL